MRLSLKMIQVGKLLPLFFVVSSLCMFSAQHSYVQNVRANGISGTKDPVALNVLAQEVLSKENGKPVENSRVVELSALSLRAQALNSTALALMGAVQSEKWRKHVGRNLNRLSLMTSRREMLANISDIEWHANSNNTDGALRSYDLALTTTPRSAEFLLPILSNAIADEKIQAALVPYVRKRAIWVRWFVEYVVGNPTNAHLLSDIIVRSNGLGSNDPDGKLDDKLIGLLIEKGQADRAKKQYLFNHPKDAAMLLSASLSASTLGTKAGQFGWRLFETSGAGVAKDEMNRLVASVEPNTKAVVARKLLALHPTTYVLSARESYSQTGPMPETNWRIVCKHSSLQIGAKQHALRHAKANGAVNLIDVAFEVPSDCPLQEIEIGLAGPSSQFATKVIIDMIEVKNVSS